MEQSQGPEEVPSQPSWTIDFAAEPDEPEAPPSKFVRVTITHDLEITDEDALHMAVDEVQGLPHDALERHLRSVPANLVGLLLSGPLDLPYMPGVEGRGSGMSIGDYEPGR